MPLSNDNHIEQKSERLMKKFKDPLYDYIEVESSIVSKIIDTPAFQRLKDIRQTSYTPLFPAAYHNRYVHSLGVYHLGRMAFNSIKPQLVEYSQDTDLYSSLKECVGTDEFSADFGSDFFLHSNFLLAKNHCKSKIFKSLVKYLHFSVKRAAT